MAIIKVNPHIFKKIKIKFQLTFDIEFAFLINGQICTLGTAK